MRFPSRLNFCAGPFVRGFALLAFGVMVLAGSGCDDKHIGRPCQIGVPPPPRRALHTVLVTGDSMSEPLDQYLAQLLSPNGVRVIQDPHIGTGISTEDMAHITEPYFTRKKTGSGLGLFIVQRILHEHGGHLELLSEPGRGTTARISLPLAERRVRLLGPGDATTRAKTKGKSA